MKLNKMNATEVMLHPETGEKLTRTTFPRTISYKGLTETIDMPGWYTQNGDDAIFTKEDLQIYDKTMKTLKSQYNNLVSPCEIQAIRKKLKLTQVQAGSLLGGGPRAFQKYESGEILPSRAASNLLRLLDQQPSLLKLLPIEG